VRWSEKLDCVRILEADEVSLRRAASRYLMGFYVSLAIRAAGGWGEPFAQRANRRWRCVEYYLYSLYHRASAEITKMMACNTASLIGTRVDEIMEHVWKNYLSPWPGDCRQLNCHLLAQKADALYIFPGSI
jgi:hypothetical protein